MLLAFNLKYGDIAVKKLTAFLKNSPWECSSPLPATQTSFCQVLPLPPLQLLCLVKHQEIPSHDEIQFISSSTIVGDPAAWLPCQQLHWLLVIWSSTPSPLSLPGFLSHYPAAVLTGKRTGIQVQRSFHRLMMTMTGSRTPSGPARWGWMWPGRRSDTSTASCTEGDSSAPSVGMQDKLRLPKRNSTVLWQFLLVVLGF